MQIHLKLGSAPYFTDRCRYLLEVVIKLFCGIYFVSTLENINGYFPFNVTHTLIAWFLEGVFVFWDQRFCLRAIRHWWQRNEDSPYQTSPLSYLGRLSPSAWSCFPGIEKGGTIYFHTIFHLRKGKLGHSETDTLDLSGVHRWSDWTFPRSAVRLERPCEPHPHRQSYWDITVGKKLIKKPIYLPILDTRTKT